MNEIFHNVLDSLAEFAVTDKGVKIVNKKINAFLPYGSFEKITYSGFTQAAMVIYQGAKYGFICQNGDARRLKEAVQYANEQNQKAPRRSAITINDLEVEPGYTFDGGCGDYLIIEEDYVTIHHKGTANALGMGLKGNKNIYYTDITAIEFREASVTLGIIQFSLPGSESKGGLLEAAHDENTVSFNSTRNEAANKVMAYLNNKLKEVKTASSGNQTIIQQVSAADEIKKFKELLDDGIISQEEFDAKKKQLLGL